MDDLLIERELSVLDNARNRDDPTLISGKELFELE